MNLCLTRGIPSLALLLFMGCGTPTTPVEPTPATTPSAPEPTSEKTAEPTSQPRAAAMSTEPVQGDLCEATGFDRLTDGRLLVVDANRSDSVSLYPASGLAKGPPEQIPLTFKSMEGPLPEQIEDLAAVASRGDALALVGSFAHADGEGCPLPANRAKILVGEAKPEGIEWQHRMRMTPCAWNGSGEYCRGEPGGLLASIELCKDALFTSKITTQGDSVCGVLVEAEKATSEGACSDAFSVAAATIVPGRAGKKLWVALDAPLSAAGETILLRIEQPLAQLDRLSFDRASFLPLPTGFSIRGLATEGDRIIGVADGPDEGIFFSFPVRELKDGEAVTPKRMNPQLPRGSESISAGLEGAVVLFGGSREGDACPHPAAVGVAAWGAGSSTTR